MYEYGAVGLIFDAAGVLLLGLAFFFKSQKSLLNESYTPDHEDYNFHSAKQAIYSRNDGALGTVLLLAGFIFQFVGSIGISNPEYGQYILWGLFIVLVLYLLVARWLLNWYQLATLLDASNYHDT